MPSEPQAGGENPAPKPAEELVKGIGNLSIEKECLRRKKIIRAKDKSYGAAIRDERVLWEDDPMNPEHLINLAFLHLADDVKKAMSNVLERCSVNLKDLDEENLNLYHQFMTIQFRDERNWEKMEEHFKQLHEPEKWTKGTTSYYAEYHGFKCILACEQKRRKDAIDAFDRISKCGGDFLMEQWIFASKSIEACDITKNSDAIVMHAIKGNAEKLKEFQMCCNMRENPDAMLNQTMAQAKSNDPWEKFFATMEKYGGVSIIMGVTCVAVVYSVTESLGLFSDASSSGNEL